MPAILDTGVVLALANTRDPAHAACRASLERERESVIVPQAILPELSYLIASRLGSAAETRFFAALPQSGWRLEGLTDADFTRVSELLTEYEDARLGFVDAAVIAIAERSGARTIYTLDRRHFTLVRPRHTEAFTLLPLVPPFGKGHE